MQEDSLGGRFVWNDGEAPKQWVEYRTLASDDASQENRGHALEELRAASLGINSLGINSDNVPVDSPVFSESKD